MIRHAFNSVFIVGMIRNRHVISFLTLAVLFVPVRFDFVFSAMVVPCSYVLLTIACAIPYFLEKPAALLALAAYLSFYGALFYALAGLSFCGCQRIARSRVRLAQGVVLAAVFSCSFIPAFKYVDWGRRTGTYTFWEACIRYSKTHGKLNTGIL